MISTIAIDASVEKVLLSHRRPGAVEYLERMYDTHPDLVTARVRRVCINKITDSRRKSTEKKNLVAASLVALLPLPQDAAYVIHSFLHGDILWKDESCLSNLTNQAMRLPMPLNGVAVSMITRSLASTFPSIDRRRRRRGL